KRAAPSTARRGTRTGHRRTTGGRPPVISLEALADQEQSATESERARETADSMVGEEEPGGTVAVPDHDRVDEFAGAAGVARSPDWRVRSAADLLDERDRGRGGRRPAPTL